MTLHQNKLATARVCAFFFMILVSGCGARNSVNSRLNDVMPKRIIWAWERPEDLRFLDPRTFGVAFLAQTILLEGGDVLPKPRHQPLELAPGTYLIAVTRIETNKDRTKRPDFDSKMVSDIVSLIKSTLDLPGVRAVQIDFDAVASERSNYRSLVAQLKKQLPPETPLTMTSLASWCTGDAWFNNFEVDEAVPMAFQMGGDEEKIRTFLRNGNDWSEPLCRGSYGLSVDDRLNVILKPERRIYYFKSTAWKPSDFQRLEGL